MLAEFTNSTGDSAFDGTLTDALATELQQSPLFNVLPPQKVNDTLKLMQRSGNERLTPKTALEVCQRAGSRAVIAGSIASLGTAYLIGLGAENCETGRSLAREVTQAESKEKVFDALDKATVKLRGQLGESLGSIQSFSTPLEQATTPSLEALHTYSAGRKDMSDPAAASFFQQAIRLDPNFAMAYFSLGITHFNFGEDSAAAENIRKAYDLWERVSQWEKFAIESRSYLSVTGDLRQARQVYELWFRAYPREYNAVANLGNIDTKLGQHERALAEYLEEADLCFSETAICRAQLSRLLLPKRRPSLPLSLRDSLPRSRTHAPCDALRGSGGY